jgi:hypothetical protein
VRNLNFNIRTSIVSEDVYVSSAAIYYEHEDRFQVETIIFSKDPRQRFRMFIHGSVFGEVLPDDKILETAVVFNRRVTALLKCKLTP